MMWYMLAPQMLTHNATDANAQCHRCRDVHTCYVIRVPVYHSCAQGTNTNYYKLSDEEVNMLSERVMPVSLRLS